MRLAGLAPLYRLTSMNRTLPFLGLAAILLVAATTAQTPIWSQHWDVQATIVSSSQTTDNAVDTEIADDFEVVGTVQVVEADGAHSAWFNSPPMNLQSAIVRFYTWNNGVPGTLVSQQQVAAAQITVTGSRGAFAMHIPLPTPFVATGRHFVSVQTVSDLEWSWHSANTSGPHGSVARIRDRRAGSGWTAAAQSDVAFVLFGTLSGPPVLQGLAASSLPRSGRLRLFGSNFGESQGTNEVRIGGAKAIVTRWTNTVIHAYVPEVLSLGSQPVRVTTQTGTSGALPLTVTARTDPAGRAIWRFQADGHSVGASVVGPDGTVYAIDDHNHLYALAPSGALLWAARTPTIGSLLTRGHDGTLYTMADGILRATNPDGTHRWDFAPPALNWTISGPTVGPDGNVYATSQYGLGFFSVTPQGSLRWSNPDVGDRVPRGHTIVFSHGQAYVNHTVQNVPAPDGRLQAYDMVSGRRQWIAPADRTVQPLIGPGGRIYIDVPLGALRRIYDPNGSVHRSEGGALGMRRFAPDLRRLYAVVPSLTRVSALDPLTFASAWTVDVGALQTGPPVPDPLDRILLARTHNPGSPGSLQAITTGGRLEWRENLHRENGGDIVFTGGPVYSPGADVAYTGTAILVGQNAPDPYSYVYAYDVLPAGIAIHGASSPGCDGPLAISASSTPNLGNAAFAILCGSAPRSATGAIAVGAGLRQQPMPMLGIDLWVDPASAWFFIGTASSDGAGNSQVRLPVPGMPALVGATMCAQFVWPERTAPSPCPASGLSATPALSITIQR